MGIKEVHRKIENGQKARLEREFHGGDITAENIKGGGAAFRFSLATEGASDE